MTIQNDQVNGSNNRAATVFIARTNQPYTPLRLIVLLGDLGLKMPLFHVQDSDRPGWVVAKNYTEAESKWRAAVAKENDDEDTGPPAGISIICEDSELIIESGWSA